MDKGQNILMNNKFINFLIHWENYATVQSQYWKGKNQTVLILKELDEGDASGYINGFWING